MTSPSQHPQQNLPEGSGTMELAKAIRVYDPVTETPSQKLSKSQEQACQVAEIKAELAKMDHINADVSQLLDQIISSALTAKTKMACKTALHNDMRKDLDNPYHGRFSGAPMRITGYTLHLTAEEGMESDAPRERGNIQRILEDVEVALRLVEVETKTRKKLKADVRAAVNAENKW
ncbi:hypothetical protein HDK90DRAFT_463307 [Phyllosticta capitalensis]|uniref:Uncharacterized protein n=1 Tax=Phyllosticta capitalensis TaxID=121624 RepID=A0ABR1Z0J1_9PEZI